jgi:hypothetical protein
MPCCRGRPPHRLAPGEGNLDPTGPQLQAGWVPTLRYTSIVDYYLGALLPSPEPVRIDVSSISLPTLTKLGLLPFLRHSHGEPFLFCDVLKTVPGLPQSVSTLYELKVHDDLLSTPRLYLLPSTDLSLHLSSSSITTLSTPVSPAEKTWIQNIVGSLLFYARALDLSLLTAVYQLSSRQFTPTHSTRPVLCPPSPQLCIISPQPPQNPLLFVDNECAIGFAILRPSRR